MNKSKLLLSLVAICLLLVLGVLALKEDRPQAVDEKGRGPLLKDFTPDSVHTITLKRAGTTVELKKKDKEWTMPQQKNRVALESKVSSLLNDLKDAKSIGTRAGKNLADFDLTPDKRTELTVERETGKTTVYLGKSLPGGDRSCAQVKEGDPILEIDKDLLQRANVQETKGVVALNPSLFYDLKIFSDKADDAIDIVVKKGNEVTRIQKVIPGKGPVEPKQTLAEGEKPVWWITEPEGGPADEGKINSVCSTVLNLNAKEYLDESVPEKDRGLDKPTAKIAVRLKDGTERLLTFGKVESAGVIVSASGKSDAYKVEQYVYDTCTKTEDMKKKEEPPPTPPGTPPGTPPIPNLNPTPQPPPPPPTINPREVKPPETIKVPPTIPVPPEKKPETEKKEPK